MYHSEIASGLVENNDQQLERDGHEHMNPHRIVRNQNGSTPTFGSWRCCRIHSQDNRQHCSKHGLHYILQQNATTNMVNRSLRLNYPS
jgi:hypothetical protein